MSHNNLNFDIYGNKDIIGNKMPICITFGNFDGVHLGHRFLIETMGSSDQVPLVVVTFNPHSSDFFVPNKPKYLLTCLQDKVTNLLNLGVSAVIVQNFDAEFASLTADDFCVNWLEKNFNVHSVFLGHDFCYGKNRVGNFEHMKKFGETKGWVVMQSDAFKYADQLEKMPVHIPISSTLIREQIATGNMENAENLLGRPYFLSGVVVQGDQRGRTLGFPTANIKLYCNYALPKYGVYACFVQIEDRELLPAVMNCGIRPSVGEGLKLQIESHILNFNEDIYGKKIKFFPKKFFRGEMKFNHIDELKSQMNQDIKQAENFFS